MANLGRLEGRVMTMLRTSSECSGYWQPTSFAKRGRSTYMRMGPDTWICLRLVDAGDASKPMKEIYRLKWFV